MRRLRAWVNRLGTAGILGIGVLLACAGFYASALAPAEQALQEGRLAASPPKSRAPGTLLPANAQASDLRRFYAHFPGVERLGEELELLYRIARAARLELAQGEYRLEKRPAGLWSYRITLPIRGSYAQIRAFLSGILTDMPVASVDGLRFERKRIGETQLDAQLRLTVHVRPSGDPR